MTDQRSEQAGSSAVDTGEPIAILRTLEEPTSATFGEKLRGRIHRRRLGADIGRLGWEGPMAVMVEMLSILSGLFGGRATDGPKER